MDKNETKMFVWVAIMNVAAWLAVAGAVVMTVYVTQKTSVLWFLLVPLINTISMFREEKPKRLRVPHREWRRKGNDD